MRDHTQTTITVYVPVAKYWGKTDTRGFYLNDKGKIDYDYIMPVSIAKYDDDVIEEIRNRWKQESIFYIDKDNIAHVFYGIGHAKNVSLIGKKTHYIIKSKRDDIKEYIKMVCATCGGCTVLMNRGKSHYNIITWR